MPIYAYRCDSCGHAKDVLQKISDPILSTCPACGAGTFHKQVTAAGFQLKGSGWYVTDFKGGGGPTAAAAAKPADAAAPAAADNKPNGGSSGSSEPGPGGSSSSGGAGPAPAQSAAGGCGSACSCH